MCVSNPLDMPQPRMAKLGAVVTSLTGLRMVPAILIATNITSLRDLLTENPYFPPLSPFARKSELYVKTSMKI